MRLGDEKRQESGGTSPEIGHRSGPIADPAPVPSDRGDTTSRTTKLPPRADTPGARPKGRTPLSDKQNSSFCPASGTTYRNEPAPRIPVELLPDEMEAVLEVLHTGYCPYMKRGAFLSGRGRMDRALSVEKGSGGILDRQRAA